MSRQTDRTTDRRRSAPAERREALTPAAESPFLRAPEGARTVFLVTLLAACGPLAGGLLLFGWRAAMVTGLSVVSCAVIERLYYRVTRVPALLGRSHAYLTGLLLGLTLPAFVPWYVPVVAAAFAIIVGKAVFGGVGHFLWQPALVGRLAVAVLFHTPLTVASPMLSSRQPVLARDRLLIGDVRRAAKGEDRRRWSARPARPGSDAFLLTPPRTTLRNLTIRRPPLDRALGSEKKAAYSALAYIPEDLRRPKPAGLLEMPPIINLLYGARPGGIGETSAIIIIVAGLYLVYRSYVKWQLPFAFLAAAWVTVAVAPIHLAGPNDTVETVWLPLLSPEGTDVGFTYVNYQLLSGELLLAAFFLATEMTSRPVAAGGQVVFGIGCGVLAMNTFTPAIDRVWRPRVFGTRHFAILRGH